MHTPATTAACARTTARSYPGTRDQIRQVRHDLHHILAGCPAADDVILCGSELAANAVLHSHTGRPGGTFTVRTDISPGSHVRIEVHDDGGPWPQPARGPGTDPDRPHGLDIITTLATAWGITETGTGRAVWARIDWLVT
jgi:anti-sigma regulatory factor (Ser/Thr protein kinase)